MRVSAAVYVMLGVGVALVPTVADSASAQVPRAESQPALPQSVKQFPIQLPRLRADLSPNRPLSLPPNLSPPPR